MGTTKMQERIPGGEPSRRWLEKHDLRDFDHNSEAAWALLQRHYGFDWIPHTSQDGTPHRHPSFMPRVIRDGIISTPSLADLIRHARGEIELPLIPKELLERGWTRRILPVLTADPVMGPAFTGLIQDKSFRTPPPGRVQQGVANWVRHAAATKEATIVLFVCPDWAVDEHDCYTFDDVGCGNGLVARRALKGLPVVWRFCQQQKLDAKVVVAIGDFEGDDPTTVERIGVDPDEFRERCRQSLLAFREAAESSMPGIGEHLHTMLATELAGSVERWQALLSEAQDRVTNSGLAAALGVRSRDVTAIAAARKSLYERWHGEGCDTEAILSRQMPEYGAMGRLALDAGPNPLILGADSAVMAHGFQILRPAENPAAVLYLFNRAY